jgi:hypothetical protein
MFSLRSNGLAWAAPLHPPAALPSVGTARRIHSLEARS